MIALTLLLELTSACGVQLPTRLATLPRQRTYNITVDTLGVAASITVPLDTAWARLPAVYQSLGLPVQERDEPLRRMGTCSYRLHGRLKGVPLSRYLDCGELRNVPNADRLEVDLLVLTAVRNDPNLGPSVATFVLASAGESVASRQRHWCLSSGLLETKIRDLVEAGPSSNDD